MALKTAIPWWAKIGAKLVLSSVRVPYGLTKRLGLIEHGAMERADYALACFDSHFAPFAERFAGRERLCILEVGPGDSLLGALAASARGAHRAIGIDSGDFITRDVDGYLQTWETLRSGKPSLPAPRWRTFDEMLAALGIAYLTDGLHSFASLETGSVDFVWSNAALEHVRRADVLPMLRAIARVLKPDGMCSHQIDLKDHLDASLNNLRFSPQVWESDRFARAGFYTNRLRHADWLQLFAEAGLRVDSDAAVRWPRPPLARERLHESFRHYSEEELSISGMRVVLSPGDRG